MEPIYHLTETQLLGIVFLVGLLMVAVICLTILLQSRILKALPSTPTNDGPTLFERAMVRQHRLRGYYMLYLQARLTMNGIPYQDELTFVDKHEQTTSNTSPLDH